MKDWSFALFGIAAILAATGYLVQCLAQFCGMAHECDLELRKWKQIHHDREVLR